MTNAFKLTARQQQAQEVLASESTYLMLFGGSRSGKTFLLCRNVAMRALKAAGSRHAILRFRFNAVKASVVMDTWPKMMKLCFPGVEAPISKTDWYAEFPNGSQVWFGGLDDKERTEKILGQEYVTIYLNEASQIPWGSVGVAITRLAQQVDQVVQGSETRPLKPRFYFDCNPPSKAHWSYKLFVKKIDPETGEAVKRPDDYASFQINPKDNAANVSAGYLETLSGLSTRLQKRFLNGEFADATPNQLFSEECIERYRVLDANLPDFVRVAVGVDPSGSGDVDNADNDAIGIMIGALGTDGVAYLLEDCTVKAGPATWGRISVQSFDRHGADVIVGEVNYGGAMVQHTIQVARKEEGGRPVPFKMVTASRGKAVRAEPFSALYETGKVRHVGNFRELEDEMMAFSTVGYLGENSPNRADAWIWVLAELFPGLVRAPKKEMKTRREEPKHWMAA